MRHIISGGLAAAALGAAMIVSGANPASAQVARPQSAFAIDRAATSNNGNLSTAENNGVDAKNLLVLVQRRAGGGGRGGGGGFARGGGGRGVAVQRYGGGGARWSGNYSRRWAGNYPRRWNGYNRNWRYNRYAYRRGWGWGGYPYYWGTGLGLALAAPYYGGGYYDGGYYAGGGGDNAVAYCMSRFKSYDPSTGTYLGYDGQRHPCP